MAIKYESDTTHFLKALRQAKPELAQQQREGRSLLWDRPQDAEAQRRFQQSRVAQAPYVYQSHD